MAIMKSGELMKTKKISIVFIFLLILLNLFQLFWYFNPLSFMGEPRVTDEETAISIARDFSERLRGTSNNGMIHLGDYIERNGNWLVQISPPRGYLGRSYTFVIRARDGRIIDFRIMQ